MITIICDAPKWTKLQWAWSRTRRTCFGLGLSHSSARCGWAGMVSNRELKLLGQTLYSSVACHYSLWYICFFRTMCVFCMIAHWFWRVVYQDSTNSIIRQNKRETLRVTYYTVLCLLKSTKFTLKYRVSTNKCFYILSGTAFVNMRGTETSLFVNGTISDGSMKIKCNGKMCECLA